MCTLDQNNKQGGEKVVQKKSLFFKAINIAAVKKENMEESKNGGMSRPIE